jgi:hypothetical protein
MVAQHIQVTGRAGGDFFSKLYELEALFSLPRSLFFYFAFGG